MRIKPLLTLVALTGPVIAPPAFAEEFNVPSIVDAATVFPSGATVKRVAEIEVPAGRHTILLEGLLGNGLNENSLRASGSGDAEFTILAVELRRPDAQALAQRLQSEQQKWSQARERLEDQRRGAEDAKRAAERQLAFIDAAIKSASASGTENNPAPTAGDWSQLWRDSAKAAQEALAAQQRADQLIRNVDRQLRQLPQPSIQNEQDVAVAVEIEADGPLSGALTVEYYHSAASWYPVYDARLETGETPALSLHRRAAVSQNTQEDWESVALTLSTAQPSGRTAAQEPRSRVIRLRPEVQAGYAADSALVPRPEAVYVPAPAPQAVVQAPSRRDAFDAQRVAKARQASAAIQQLGETVVYEITARADIPAGTASRRVLIGESPITPSLELRATPSQDQTAYLYAAFENDGALILPGEASLLKDGLFVGRAQLKSIAPGEPGAIPFGPIETVKIAYRVAVRKDDDRSGIIAPEQSHRFRAQTRLENYGETARTLRIYEAIPIERDDDVDVELVANPAPTETDAEDTTGRLVWEIELAAGEEATLEFGYDITWPFGRQLLGR